MERVAAQPWRMSLLECSSFFTSSLFLSSFLTFQRVNSISNRQENATLRAAALRRDAQLNAAEADAASKVEELSALREQLEKLRAASRLKEGSVEQVASLEQQVSYKDRQLKRSEILYLNENDYTQWHLTCN